MYCFPPTKFSSPLTMLVKQNIVLSNYLYFDFFCNKRKSQNTAPLYFFAVTKRCQNATAIIIYIFIFLSRIL